MPVQDIGIKTLPTKASCPVRVIMNHVWREQDLKVWIVLMLCIEQVLLFFFNIVAIGILISENLGKSSSAGWHTSDPHVHADEVRKFQSFYTLLTHEIR